MQQLEEIVYSEADGFPMLVGGSYFDRDLMINNVSDLNNAYITATERVGSRLSAYMQPGF